MDYYNVIDFVGYVKTGEKMNPEEYCGYISKLMDNRSIPSIEVILNKIVEKI